MLRGVSFIGRWEGWVWLWDIIGVRLGGMGHDEALGLGWLPFGQNE